LQLFSALPQVRVEESNYHFGYEHVKEKQEIMISFIYKFNRGLRKTRGGFRLSVNVASNEVSA